jgi:integrase
MGEYLKTRYPGIFQYVGKNGTTYGIDYYAGGKKHREMVGPLLGEAQKKLNERKDQAGKGIAVNKKKTFRELAREYSKLRTGTPSHEKSQKYFIGYLDENNEWKDMSLTARFGDWKISQITSYEIEKFRQERKEALANGKERSNVSVNRELEILRHMLNKAIEWGWLDYNPFNKFINAKGESSIFYEEIGRDRFLTRDEIPKLLEAAPPYLRNIIIAGIYTQLRKGDLLRLKWEQVNLETGLLTYREQKKGNKVNHKYLNDDMINLLMTVPKGKSEYIFNGPVHRDKEKGKKEKYVALPDPDGKPLTNIKRAFNSACKKAGIKDLHFHDLRHTGASHLAMSGATLLTVQKQLGHTNIAMTQRYSHLASDFERQQVNLMNGLCGEIKAGSKKLVRNEEILQNRQEPYINATA